MYSFVQTLSDFAAQWLMQEEGLPVAQLFNHKHLSRDEVPLTPALRAHHSTTHKYLLSSSQKKRWKKILSLQRL